MEKKTKLTISGTAKKSIKNIEIAKTQGKNSVVIEKQSNKFPSRGVSVKPGGFKPKTTSTFNRGAPIKPSFPSKSPPITNDFERRKLAEQRATKRLKGENDSKDKKTLKAGTKKRELKLTVSRALSDEIEARARSEASVKRARQKENKNLTKEEAQESLKPVKRDINIPEAITVRELANRMAEQSSNVIKYLFGMGVTVTINQTLAADTAEFLVKEFGHNPIRGEKAEEIIQKIKASRAENLKNRAPIVTVMGHVDHGKTSLLDHIRDANVVAGESGGITQHIGAYKVELESGNHITFLDTPGHEAFTAMRARGAKVTDMVVLVVAANDGVMPQTIESIDHARAANVPLIIAINKTDLPDTDIDRIKRELSEHEVLVEDWGGKVQAVPISAKSGDGIEDLMNAVILESEVLELKANKDTLAKGTVIDSRLDKGHGAIATVLIQKGTLKIGDPFMCASYSGKVRALLNERGQRIQEAFPSDAIQVLGFDKVPQTADILSVVENERELKRISSERQRIKREIDQKKIGAQSLDAMSAMIKEGAIKNLPLIIKGDVDGSIEALSETLEKLSTDEVGIQIIHKAVGMISESDVLLAEASQAVIIGFNVQVSSNAKLQANQAGVEIRNYSIIYNAVEEIKLALEGLLEPDKIEEVVGRAEILTQFKIPKIGNIAGTKVVMGIINRGAKARVIHDDETIHEGNVTSLKRFKDDAKEVKEGLECGIGVDGVKTFNEGDIIEIFEIKTVKRTLG